MAPEQLWILNPKKLLTRQIDPCDRTADKNGCGGFDGVELRRTCSPEEGQSFLVVKKDCWICYDSEKPEALIQPCKCTGDVSSVHHECLRMWLVESCAKDDEAVPKCKVCDAPYEIKRTNK